MNVRNVVLVLSGLCVGLVTSGVFVGRASAQQAQPAGGAIRYEYMCATGLPGQLFRPDAIAAANRFGADGWRLLDGISAQNHMSGADQYCFVRQVSGPAQSPH